jgi:hypothetical protein
MGRGVDRLPHRGDVGGRAGRGLVVDDADCLDLLLAVAAQACLDLIRLHAAAPVRRFGQQRIVARGRENLDREAEARGHLDPERREVAGLDHQHRVAGRERVDQRRFPGAGARRRIDHHRMARLENLLHFGEHLPAECAELGPAMIDRRQAHRPQNAIGHRARPGDLQEMAAGRMKVEVEHHWAL